ncbi:MAG TPA: hypothetical protein VF157_04600 [Chloroflexota bacterium]
METLAPPPRRVDRDDARQRARGHRRFHRASESNFPPPPEGDEGPIWPPPPAPSESHLQWPYWLLLLAPWATLGVSLLLEHMQVCLICLPSGAGLNVP